MLEKNRSGTSWYFVVIHLTDRFLARWSVRCEDVADAVRSLDVDQQQVRMLAREPVTPEGIVNACFDQYSAQRAHGMAVWVDRLRRLLILELGEPGQQGLHLGVANLTFDPAEPVARPRFLRRWIYNPGRWRRF